MEVWSDDSSQEHGVVYFYGLRPLIFELAECLLPSRIVLAGCHWTCTGGTVRRGFGAREKRQHDDQQSWGHRVLREKFVVHTTAMLH
jgi:hypothetical protein